MHEFTRIKKTPIKLTALLIGAFMTLGTVNAFNDLNKAQTLIYDTAHLQNTENDQELVYMFMSEELGQEPVQDKAKLVIQKKHENGTRDVAVDFLSDERRIALPDFNGFKGNPIIIAMLEHIAQKMGRDTGGGALYFRNRIRDALAGDVTISEEKLMLADTELQAVVLTFKPFVDDQYIRGLPQYVNSRFSITLSEAVSGGVIGIKVDSVEADKTYFTETLSLKQ